MVPEAEFRSYYGRPVIKEPVWKVPDVPAYLYLGGLAGASSTMALLADATGRPVLTRTGRISAAAGATASVAFLIHDLGRPARFLNMLRVFKPTSPLSVGSWILAPFSALAGAGAASDLTGLLPGLGRLSSSVAGVVAPAMTTYTAVLLSDTAVPGWHEPFRELPYVFAGSAVASAGAVGMLAAPAREAAPARRMAVAGAALELAASHRMEHRDEVIGEVYRTGRAGTVLRAAKALTVAGAVGAVFARRSRVAAVAAGVCLSAAGAATRYGVFEAGRQSARDPRYTVVPQRRRAAV
ncbi:NrfD/PsrC family molybdoenzyme membrane anchor subunit [Saccharopolyspora cebuensis]|uniref:NrfD/PsrC family molybdoenzyme membrane anchor subunit n=1 Tax=Saccharopolyspora cebuensis TaxID=418759 RepID=A0ABV4CD16_9PSEU